MNVPSRSGGPAYSRCSHAIEPSSAYSLQRRHRVGRHEHDVAVARQQPLHLLEPHLAAAHDQAAPPASAAGRRCRRACRASPARRTGRRLPCGAGRRTPCRRRRRGHGNRVVTVRPAPTEAAQRPARHLEQRHGALAQRALAVGLAGAVQQLRRRADRLAQRLVVRVPPEVAHPAGLVDDQLHVHALVEAELRVRSAQSRVLDPAPRHWHAPWEHMWSLIHTIPDSISPRSADPCTCPGSTPTRRGRTRSRWPARSPRPPTPRP